MLKGSIVAIVTPFDSQGNINEAKLKELIDWHIDCGTDGILVCGTTGESATLTHPEHKRIIDLAVLHIDKRVPVLAGCGSNSTHEALDLVTHAKSAGADFALVITPYYNKPTQEGLYRHFKEIADNVDMPIIIYNVPSRTGSNILPETVARIYKDCKNVVGIKEASGSLDQITKIMSLVDDKFLLFSGSDEINLPILATGASGVVSVAANIVPKEIHQLVAKFLEGDLAEARKIQLHLYELIKTLFVETNPIPVKTALGLMGLIEPNMRLPLCNLSETNLSTLKIVLKKYKLI
ncbi:MAG: 4-hydroxy-tetrahydrodipicolinate synthase [Candidatus Omnitrophica bacterium]|nr:4-hydroxy-tetrahydrodipicolinate synthase [Candidatus Omnitrophota bacterium]